MQRFEFMIIPVVENICSTGTVDEEFLCQYRILRCAPLAELKYVIITHCTRSESKKIKYQIKIISFEFNTKHNKQAKHIRYKLFNCRGQCYDGTSNMSGSRNDVAKKILEEENRALYTHCYSHALNLAVSNTMKKSKVCKDALETAFEITRLVKFTLKRNAAFDKIRAAKEDDNQSPVGLRTFCHTRWTVREDSLESVVANYNSLLQLWEESLESGRLEPDVKARIIGVKTVMQNFRFLYGLTLSETVLKLTDNLSKTLQHTSLSAAAAQKIASMTITTLEGMRSDASALTFINLVMALQLMRHKSLAGGNFPHDLTMERQASDMILSSRSIQQAISRP